MGIPRFFKWISESFNDTVISTGEHNINLTADCLHLDANGIIHNAVRDVFFPSQKVRFAPKSQKIELSRDEKELQVFKNICSYMKKLHDLTKPKKLFYIAIDGVAPVAKQAQQRQRRYKSAEDKSLKDFEIFDTNAITPGTEFLKRLTEYIHIWVKGSKFGCEVRFSDPSDPGEGEHKLMKYIRSNKNLSHIVYGLDADLFMLTLASHCKNIWLLREDIFHANSFDTFFHIVNVQKISIGLWEKYRNNYKCEISQEDFINDFVFYCFLVGNDFLHNSPCLWDLEASVDMMLSLEKIDKIVDSSDFGINMESLTYFLKQIAEREEKLLGDQLRTKRFENVVLNSSMKNVLDKKAGIDLNVFRREYYKKMGIVDNEGVLKICRRYLQGLGWVNWYYRKTAKNWRWLYVYHHSPLITDIIVYIENSKIPKPIHHIKSDCLTAEQQLMCVIPPRSVDLLPKKLRVLHKHPDLVKYYPEKFERDLSGKLREWEAIALLPFIDLKVLLGVMKSV